MGKHFLHIFLNLCPEAVLRVQTQAHYKNKSNDPYKHEMEVNLTLQANLTESYAKIFTRIN